MKLIDLVKLIIENKDTIIAIIEFLKQIGIIKTAGNDGVVTISTADVDMESLDTAMALAGRGESFIELIRFLIENKEALYDLYLLFRELFKKQ